MKEALQLADRQRQTDAIVHEIRQANESIRYEIRSGFANLGYAMVKCVEGLSRQISSQQQEILSVLNSNNEALQSIASSAELNNALQEKSNATSDQLKDDYDYMLKKTGIKS